jgi:hypothetical protein
MTAARKTHTGNIQPTEASPDGRLNAPSAARNLAPILTVLRSHLPAAGCAIEFASGTGQHIAAFAEAFPGIHWTPTDVEPERLVSIEAWRAASGLPNLAAPLHLNVGDPEWPFTPASMDAALTINLLHLVSSATVESLFAGAATLLKPGGLCIIYGPFMRDGQFVSEGDRSFHTTLQGMDSAIGYKDKAWVEECAAARGLHAKEWVQMPANNLMLVAIKEGVAA